MTVTDFSAASGAPLQFHDPDAPQRRFLLDASVPWHTGHHRWGSGHLVTDRGGARWHTPTRLERDPGGTSAVFAPLPGARLTVERRVTGAAFLERYTLTNEATSPLRVDGCYALVTLAGRTETPALEIVRELIDECMHSDGHPARAH